LAAQSFVLPPVRCAGATRGGAGKRAPHRLQGTLEVGGQEHFYLEGQIAYALPLEQGQWHIYSQHPAPRRGAALGGARAGLDNHAVRVECRRMGGGFGGKETQAGHLAVWAALAAHKLAARSSCGWTATTTS
jgi:xanthine dehydrogenase large subunit